MIKRKKALLEGKNAKKISKQSHNNLTASKKKPGTRIK